MLEQKIEALTAAVIGLTAAISAAPAAATPAEVPAAPAKRGRPAAAAPAAAAPAAAAPAAAAPAAAAPAAAAPGASFDDVKAATLKMLEIVQKEGALAVLQEFGAARATELKPEKYAAFIARANAVIEGAGDDLAG